MSSATPSLATSVVPATRETRHAMKLRHKAELKALMAAPTKGIGAKKKQKEDAAAMEAQHELQLKELDRKEKEEKEKEEAGEAGAGSDEAKTNETEEDDPISSSAASPPATSSKQPSRAQKKKAAKAEKEKVRHAELVELTKDMIDSRGIENAAIAKQLASVPTQKLHVHEMVSDGHCLYRAVADQVQRHHLASELPWNDNATPFMALRQLTAQYIEKHKSDFEAFMIIEDEKGNHMELNDAAWKKYLTDLVDEEKAVWGSHTEVVALSKVLRRPILIWSADGKMEVGEEFRTNSPASPTPVSSSTVSSPTASPLSPAPDHQPLQISFHQHYYGLGSHYNSVIADDEKDAAEEFAGLNVTK